jgi:RNA polymerase sigma factor (sigma-70 family)
MQLIQFDRRSKKRLPAAEEERIANEIVAEEARALAAISTIAASRAILDVEPRGQERTRAGATDRLRKAIEAAEHAGETKPKIRARAEKARRSWKRAEALRWQLALSGYQIVQGEAKKFMRSHMRYEDLMQEGHIGLIRAAKRFNPNRKLRFSTYARWWVRAQMHWARDHTSRTIRLPSGAVEQHRNLFKMQAHFEEEGVEFGEADLAEAVGISVDRARLLLSHGTVLSIDAPVDDGPTSQPWIELLSSPEQVTPEEEVMGAHAVQQVLDLVPLILSERERYVVTHRFGLGDNNPGTLSEVGRALNLSRERVRQIERDALARLRDTISRPAPLRTRRAQRMRA